MKETKYLKENIQNIQRLMDIPSLRKFETRNLGNLLRLSKIREYGDGEFIIRQGDVDLWVYFLLYGKITVIKDGVQLQTIDKRGEIFGEMRIISDAERTASIFSVGHTICLAVDTGARERLESQDEVDRFLLLLYQVFSEFIVMRLRLTSEELVKTKKEILKLVQDDVFLDEHE